MRYVATGIGEAKAASVSGDFSRGAHGTFIKQPGGFDTGVHVHTESYYAVVISGVLVNGAPGSTDIPLPPGSYWFQKEGEKHSTRCISSTECLALIVQPGKFDFVADPPSK